MDEAEGKYHVHTVEDKVSIIAYYCWCEIGENHTSFITL